MPLKIIFAGTPDFAVPALQALIDSAHHVVAVYTQPDKPKGRGQKYQAPPVKVLAESHQIPVYQPESLRDEAAQKMLTEHQADLMVVVAYGLILPQVVLDIPRLGCINIHPSLLPKWRGAAPIQRSLEAGETETGVTIMQMDAGMDTGPILLQEKVTLSGHENSLQAHDLFSKIGATHLLPVIEAIECGTCTPVAQNELEATYANKISKDEKIIDWHQSALMIQHQIQAFNPWPVATTTFQKQPLKIYEAKAIKQTGTNPPGMLVNMDDDSLSIATGEGCLQIKSLQLPGKKRVLAKDFIHGHQANLIINKTMFG